MGLSREILAGIEERLHEHAGFDLPEWVVETRAIARMGALSLEERAYLDLLGSPRGDAELHALVELVRVGETSFFRHLPQVNALIDVVVPAWRAKDRKSPRVWSAGCATGEEPYTLALVLARMMPRPAFSPRILATDVSAEAIAIARQGVYSPASADDVPEPFRSGLSVERGAVRVRPEVASLVKFQRQNLADAEVPRGFDLVWCRNVLIYFGPEARRKVLARIVGALEPGGFLFLGYSETLRDVPGLAAVRHGDQVLWQKVAATTSSQPVPGAAPPATASLRAPSRENEQPVSRIQPPASGLRPPASAVRAPSKAPGSLRAPGIEARAPQGRSAPPRALPETALLRVTEAEPKALSAELRAALAAPGLRTLTIDLDGAEFLDDEVAPVLRRAGAAAESAGIDLVLSARRPGPQRWLRRHGLSGGER